MTLASFLSKGKELQLFLGSEIRSEILYYLKDHEKVFISQLSKELDHSWNSIYNRLKDLIYLGLIKVVKEEKARGRAKRRRYHSITEEGLEFIRVIERLSPLIS